MLAGCFEKALVIGALALGKRVATPPRPFAAGIERFERGEVGPAVGEVVVVDVLGGRHHHVHKRLHGDGEQVGAYPVKAHARRNENAQDKRQADGQAIGGVFLGARLLALQRVDDVLRAAHDHGGEARQKRHDPRRTAVFDGDHSQELGAGCTAIGYGMDDVDQAEQDDNLHQQRHHGKQRMIAALFVHSALFFADGFTIAVVRHFYAVERRHKVHHDEGVFLHP